MSVTIAQILESQDWKAALERVRLSYTQTVMASGTSEQDRARALMKFHMLEQIEVDLSMHK